MHTQAETYTQYTYAYSVLYIYANERRIKEKLFCDYK